MLDISPYFKQCTKKCCIYNTELKRLHFWGYSETSDLVIKLTVGSSCINNYSIPTRLVAQINSYEKYTVCVGLWRNLKFPGRSKYSLDQLINIDNEFGLYGVPAANLVKILFPVTKTGLASLINIYGLKRLQQSTDYFCDECGIPLTYCSIIETPALCWGCENGI